MCSSKFTYSIIQSDVYLCHLCILFKTFNFLLPTKRTNCSENEKIGNSNSIDQKFMHPIEDPAYSDVSSLNKNSLDNCRVLGQLPLDPVKQVGGQLLTSKEANVCNIYLLYISLSFKATIFCHLLLYVTNRHLSCYFSFVIFSCAQRSIWHRQITFPLRQFSWVAAFSHNSRSPQRKLRLRTI